MSEYGEKMLHEGCGVVIGDDTGRVVAKFSHEAEAESFCGLVEENKKLQATNQQLLEALQVCAHWMEWWLNTAECECEYGHSCGYNERKAELKQIQKAITNAKQREK